MSIFEIRHYQIKEGGMAEWLPFMEHKIVPFIVSKGMVVTALFESEDDPNAFIWIRRFDSEEHRDELYKAVYETDEWQTNFKPTVRRLVDVEKAVVQRVKGTQFSPMR
ncbi:MAG: NIPSNAP family protein [Rhizobiaceae bacterium]